MIHAKLDENTRKEPFFSSKIGEMALKWLENNTVNTNEGIYPLGEDGFFARIMHYPTKTREQARFEVHRHTIDIQYTISGAEGIVVCPSEQLEPLDDYSIEKDVEHFSPSDIGDRVDNLKGRYTVLFPGEAHMPQLLVDGHDSVCKVVVKIPVKLMDV